jgi:hypothetical protein
MAALIVFNQSTDPSSRAIRPPTETARKAAHVGRPLGPVPVMVPMR